MAFATCACLACYKKNVCNSGCFATSQEVRYFLARAVKDFSEAYAESPLLLAISYSACHRQGDYSIPVSCKILI